MSNWFPFSANVQVQYGDLAVSSQNPGIEYGGTEPNALYIEQREINGYFYTTSNATWSKFAQIWTLVDPTKAAYGIRLGTTGTFDAIMAAAGASPFSSWTITGTLGGAGLVIRAGSQASVAADGSAATPISFSTPMGFTPIVVASASNNYASNPYQLSVQTTGESSSGFTVTVSGGPPGSTTTINYHASGAV